MLSLAVSFLLYILLMVNGSQESKGRLPSSRVSHYSQRIIILIVIKDLFLPSLPRENIP